MMRDRARPGAAPAQALDVAAPPPWIGTAGRLAILAATLALVALTGGSRWPLALALGYGLNGALYPGSVRNLLRPRWLLLAALILVPQLLWAWLAPGAAAGPSGELAPTGNAALEVALGEATRMTARALLVVLATNGFARAVDISQVAWLFEKLGLAGLGFSLGVAVNLLPALAESGRLAWHSLRLRGGFGRLWWRGLRLLLVTVVANSLRRGEEIAIAAEARAFSPDRARPAALVRGRADAPLALALAAAIAILVLMG